MNIRVQKEVELDVVLDGDGDGGLEVVVTDENGDCHVILSISRDGEVNYDSDAVDEAGLTEY